MGSRCAQHLTHMSMKTYLILKQEVGLILLEEVDSYFEVDGVTVDMHSGSFYIESKDDDDIFKVLQYIDETIS